jgi:hypothetical protein
MNRVGQPADVPCPHAGIMVIEAALKELFERFDDGTPEARVELWTALMNMCADLMVRVRRSARADGNRAPHRT